MRIPPHLQPTPLQKALHGFQLGLGVAALPLHLLQVAGVGLQGVKGPDGILERPPGGGQDGARHCGLRAAPTTTAPGASLPRAHPHPNPPHGDRFPQRCPWPPTPTASPPPWGRAGSTRACRRDGLLIGGDTPPLPGCPLAPRGGHRAAHHRAPTPATAGQGRRQARAGGAPVPARPPRWCLISGANEATELHLHGARGAARLHSHGRCQSSAVPPSPRTRAGGTQAWPWHQRVL